MRVLPAVWAKVKQRLKSDSIFRAFVISIGLHILAFFVVEGGHTAGLWETRAVPKWALIDPKTIEKMAAEKDKEQSILTFIEVDPQSPAEEPKDTPLYSTAPTQAANPDTTKDTPKPKIDGTQTQVPKTRDVVKADPKPAVPPPQPQAPPPKRETLAPATKPVQTAEAEPVGDTKQNTLTPEEKSEKDITFDRPQQPKPQTPRPRTLADARAAKGVIEGPKMKQDGGVKKYALEMDQNVKSSPFGSYDAAFIAAVQARWFQLLEQRNYIHSRSGKVVVDFRLYKDGRIMQLKVAENQVNDTLAWACQRAIQDPAPYAPFPPDLKRLLNAEYREVRFTFHYN